MAVASGQREDLYPSGGAFVAANEMPHRLNEPWMRDEIENHADWEGAVVLFRSKGGDCLVARSDSTIGWWIGEEHRIVDFCRSIPEFLDRYVEHRRSAWVRVERGAPAVPWPFDPFGPPKR